jgi:hypothetical protein
MSQRPLNWDGFYEMIYATAEIFYSEKPEGKRELERPRHRLEDNIKSNLKQTGYKCVDWIHLAEDVVQ